MARHFGGVDSFRYGEKTKALVLAGVVALLFGSLVVILFLSSSKPPEPTTQTVVVERDADVKMISVLVPVKDIDAATPLEPALFRVESRPQVGVASNAIKSFEEIKGLYARSLIISGQPLLRDYITSVRPSSVITTQIPKGYRAVTIRVDARTSVEGFVRPGATVDVHWISTLRGKPAVAVIAQNAKVLSAERKTDTNQPGAEIPSTVTLLVSEEDARKIQLASSTGSLSLSLKGDSDTGPVNESQPLTIDELVRQGGQEKAPPPGSTCEGTIKIAGQTYCIQPGGKMVPAT